MEAERIQSRHEHLQAKSGDVQIIWMRSHQKARKYETKEEQLNREKNDVADEAAVKQHMPSKTDLLAIEFQSIR